MFQNSIQHFPIQHFDPITDLLGIRQIRHFMIQHCSRSDLSEFSSDIPIRPCSRSNLSRFHLTFRSDVPVRLHLKFGSLGGNLGESDGSNIFRSDVLIPIASEVWGSDRSDVLNPTSSDSTFRSDRSNILIRSHLKFGNPTDPPFRFS
jgi:hypothetical protein